MWQIAAATGWSVKYILWGVNYQTLRMLLAGADKTSVNTAAIQRPDLIREGAERFGSQIGRASCRERVLRGV